MAAALKWLARLALVVVVGAGSGLYFASFTARATPVSYVASSVVPIDANTQNDEAPATLPGAAILPVPYTDQAPLGNWAARQHTCEEASLVMVDRYLSGDHSGGLIDPATADQAINRITAWKPSVDLTPQQVGQLAQGHLGWAYRILPANQDVMKQQLALGRPLIIGVRTHGLGNPDYPGYTTHYEQPGWSVSHYLVVVGYDSSGSYVLNDPGITPGQGFHISFGQLMHAIDDLDEAYPNLSMGRVFLVLAPPTRGRG